MQPIPEGRAKESVSAGAWLRNARQQRGLHIAALAVMLKVPQAKLEALEADRFDELPDATFARALARAMCRALKVDAAPVLALLPRTGHDFDVRPGLNQPFRERGAGAGDGQALATVMRPIVWGPVLLLAAAAAVYWIPAGWLPERDTAVPQPAASGTVAAASAPVEFIAAPAASEPVVAASTPLPMASASAPVVAQPTAQPASAPAVPAGQAPLRVTATADSWIEVVDAKGQTLLSRVLRAGEQQEFGGAAPFKLRVGNVSGTKVEWRGSAFDLNARASNNVARVELN
jgi:cytoskeleton protein RodZ